MANILWVNRAKVSNTESKGVRSHLMDFIIYALALGSHVLVLIAWCKPSAEVAAWEFDRNPKSIPVPWDSFAQQSSGFISPGLNL